MMSVVVVVYIYCGEYMRLRLGGTNGGGGGGGRRIENDVLYVRL